MGDHPELMTSCGGFPDNGGGTQQVSVSPLDNEEVQSFAAEVNQRLAAQTS